MALGFLVILVLAILAGGSFWLARDYFTQPREAPEAERVLSAQAALPFQVLIPAYLPRWFEREAVEILTGQPGPNGEEMVRLIYSTRDGYSLTFSEWLPEEPAGSGSGTKRCICLCTSRRRSHAQAGHQASGCSMLGMELAVGAVHVKVEFSTPNLMPYEELQFVLETLGPAANRQVYSSIEDVPLSLAMPEPVDVPLDSEGVQELTLVVSPQGYTPVHFAVKKDLPVRLIFRQLGEVGCGNELIFQWGRRENATLILDSPSDQEIVEFTPSQAGEFRFNCPHLIYRGLMTVTD
jgi:hypothetical protein